jgi:hypothetical protein
VEDVEDAEDVDDVDDSDSDFSDSDSDIEPPVRRTRKFFFFSGLGRAPHCAANPIPGGPIGQACSRRRLIRGNKSLQAAQG